MLPRSLTLLVVATALVAPSLLPSAAADPVDVADYVITSLLAAPGPLVAAATQIQDEAFTQIGTTNREANAAVGAISRSVNPLIGQTNAGANAFIGASNRAVNHAIGRQFGELNGDIADMSTSFNDAIGTLNADANIAIGTTNAAANDVVGSTNLAVNGAIGGAFATTNSAVGASSRSANDAIGAGFASGNSAVGGANAGGNGAIGSAFGLGNGLAGGHLRAAARALGEDLGVFDFEPDDPTMVTEPGAAGDGPAAGAASDGPTDSNPMAWDVNTNCNTSNGLNYAVILRLSATEVYKGCRPPNTPYPAYTSAGTATATFSTSTVGAPQGTLKVEAPHAVKSVTFVYHGQSFRYSVDSHPTSVTLKFDLQSSGGSNLILLPVPGGEKLKVTYTSTGTVPASLRFDAKVPGASAGYLHFGAHRSGVSGLVPATLTVDGTFSINAAAGTGSISVVTTSDVASPAAAGMTTTGANPQPFRVEIQNVPTSLDARVAWTASPVKVDGHLKTASVIQSVDVPILGVNGRVENFAGLDSFKFEKVGTQIKVGLKPSAPGARVLVTFPALDFAGVIVDRAQVNTIPNRQIDVLVDTAGGKLAVDATVAYTQPNSVIDYPTVRIGDESASSKFKVVIADIRSVKLRFDPANLPAASIDIEFLSKGYVDLSILNFASGSASNLLRLTLSAAGGLDARFVEAGGNLLLTISFKVSPIDAQIIAKAGNARRVTFKIKDSAPWVTIGADLPATGAFRISVAGGASGNAVLDELRARGWWVLRRAGADYELQTEASFGQTAPWIQCDRRATFPPWHAYTQKCFGNTLDVVRWEAHNP